MGFLWISAVKDVRRRLADRTSLLLWLGIPLLIGGLMSLAIGGGSGPSPRAKVLVADQDDSFLSNALLSMAGGAGGEEGLLDVAEVELGAHLQEARGLGHAVARPGDEEVGHPVLAQEVGLPLDETLGSGRAAEVGLEGRGLQRAELLEEGLVRRGQGEGGDQTSEGAGRQRAVGRAGGYRLHEDMPFSDGRTIGSERAPPIDGPGRRRNRSSAPARCFSPL